MNLTNLIKNETLSIVDTRTINSNIDDKFFQGENNE